MNGVISMIATTFTARHRATLRAIADGRGRLVMRHVPSLTVDELWCDFIATNELVGGGLIEPAWSAPIGTAAPAVLTPSGAALLAGLGGPADR